MPETRERRRRPESLLCVVNFPANTGYAWNFIEALYAGVADRLAERGVATWVAYPAMPSPPATLRASIARPVELPLRLDDRRALGAAIDFIRTRNVRVLYLSDRASWHPAYLALRLAGVRRIVVHDHSSGARTVPGAAKRTAKWLSRRVPGMLADEVIGVSDYVARRKVHVDLVPAARVRRIWNSIPLPEPDPGARRQLRETLGLAAGRPVVACACRATPEKGVQHLLRAFDRIGPALPGDRRPALGLLLASVVLLIGGTAAILAGPTIVRAIGLPALWNVLRWPIAFALLVALLWMIYLLLPNRDQSGAKGETLVGAVVGAGLWLVATAGFRYYIANFSSYSETYGFVGGVIVLMLWLYLTAVATLLGGEVAAVLERSARGGRRDARRAA